MKTQGTMAKNWSEWDKNVSILASNIRAAMRDNTAHGIVGLSRANLKQIVSTRGLTIAANPSTFDRCFEQALEAAKLPKGYVY